MKNIVICCDGTGNEFGRNNTNVVLTYVLAEKDEGQVVYYDPGVGTGGWEYEEDGRGLRAKSDQATGGGLQRNVEDAYRYLMASYEPGDHVYLFGFSRGAFTVRSLAGMLHRCGLLRADAGNFVEYAGKMYNATGREAVARGVSGGVREAVPGALHRRLGHRGLPGPERRQAFPRRRPEPGGLVRLPCPRHRRGAPRLPALPVGRGPRSPAGRPSSRSGSRACTPTSAAGTTSAACPT